MSVRYLRPIPSQSWQLPELPKESSASTSSRRKPPCSNVEPSRHGTAISIDITEIFPGIGQMGKVEVEYVIVAGLVGDGVSGGLAAEAGVVSTWAFGLFREGY